MKLEKDHYLIGKTHIEQVYQVDNQFYYQNDEIQIY